MGFGESCFASASSFINLFIYSITHRRTQDAPQQQRRREVPPVGQDLAPDKANDHTGEDDQGDRHAYHRGQGLVEEEEVGGETCRVCVCVYVCV